MRALHGCPARPLPTGITPWHVDFPARRVDRRKSRQEYRGVPYKADGALGDTTEHRRGKVMRLDQKVAIVTGGANGIGRAIVMLFAREGARVVVADRDAAAGEGVVSVLAGEGLTALCIATDVSSDAQVEALIDRTAEHYRGIDVLVNCAGIDIQGSVVDTEPARWQRVLDVNLMSAYRTCR